MRYSGGREANLMCENIIVTSILFFLFGYATLGLTNELACKPLAFAQIDSEKMMQFERDIGYFFGAKNLERVADHYIKAIKAFEKTGIMQAKIF